MASKKSVKSKARGSRAAKSSARKGANKKSAKKKSARKSVGKKSAVKKSAKKVAARKPAKKAAVKKTAKKVVVATAAKPDTKSSANIKHPVLKLILTRLDEDQAANTIHIDLANKSTIADWMVVTSGRSNRHVNAIADHVIESLHKSGISRVRVEGMPNCDWVLIDAGDVIVHIFRPEVRAFYNLEKMWTREPAQA
jgi:ribosome-associated protein